MSSAPPLTLSKMKPEMAVKELAKKKSNRNCFDCGRSGPQHNVNSTTNTFVCTQCAGLHRKYNHKVKTISMSTFSPAEVDALTEGGNKRARKYWLATFEEGRSYPIDQEDPANIDRFMQLCYVDKKWAKPIGATSPAGRDDDEDSVSRNERKKKKADKEKSLKRQATSDRAFTEATFPSSIAVTTAAPAAAAPAAKAPAVASTLDLGIDFLSNLTVSTPAQTQPAAASAADDFGFDDAPVAHAAPRFDSNAQGSAAGLFDSAPLVAPAASAGSNSAAVQALVGALRSVQSAHGLSIPQLNQAVQSALSQIGAGGTAGGLNGSSPAHVRTHTPVAPYTQAASTPAPAATLEDAFADIAIPDDSAAGGADTGNPFDSSDDEDEQSPSSHASYPQHTPSPHVISPQQAQQSQHMSMHAQPAFQPQQQVQQQQQHFQAQAQQLNQQQQQQLQFQQQMMFQQQMLAAQQQQHAMAQPQQQQAFGAPQQANGFNSFGGQYGVNQPQMQQQQQGQSHQRQASQQQSPPQFQVQAAAPPVQAAPSKPDLFAGLGGLSGF